MAPLYTVEELLTATGGRAGSVALEDVSAVSIDSREMTAGGLFAAIRGVSQDGHDYVRAAFENGAGMAMVSAVRADDFADLPILIVEDVLAGLEALARHARARGTAKIVAVTGSAGKTTTKNAIHAVLAGFGATHASIRSFNNHWGVPLMLASMPRDSAFGVFEIGMSHPGEIGPLSRLVRPDVAVITTIAEAHMEAFTSLAGIAAAKAEIFEGLVAGGSAVVNRDHDQLDILIDAAKAAGAGRIVTYGYADGADVVVSQAMPDGDGQVAHVSIGAEQVRLRIAARGRHMLANATAALVVGDVLGLDVHRASALLETFGAGEGRGEVIRLGSPDQWLTIIDESYNANPASMRAALDSFAQRPAESGRRILVLGDMLELGAHAAGLHKGLAAAVEAANADLVFLVGPEMRALAEALGEAGVAGWAHGAEDIEDAVLMALALGDTVMIKGSNGVRLSSLVARIRREFGESAAS